MCTWGSFYAEKVCLLRTSPFLTVSTKYSPFWFTPSTCYLIIFNNYPTLTLSYSLSAFLPQVIHYDSKKIKCYRQCDWDDSWLNYWDILSSNIWLHAMRFKWCKINVCKHETHTKLDFPPYLYFSYCFLYKVWQQAKFFFSYFCFSLASTHSLKKKKKIEVHMGSQFY